MDILFGGQCRRRRARSPRNPGVPADRPVPQASIESELAAPDAVAAEAADLEAAGFPLLHGAHTPSRGAGWSHDC